MALTALPGRLIFPWHALIAFAGASFVSLTINDDTDEVAIIFQSPAAGALQTVAFLTGTTTTGENGVPGRLETLNASGNPSGTLIDSPTNVATGTVDIAAADDNVLKTMSINGGTGVTEIGRAHV